MATVIYAICSNAYYGNPTWGGKVSEVARDAYFDGNFTSFSLWESNRDGAAQAGDDEIGEIVGTWAAVDNTNVSIAGWANVPNSITVEALDLARHDGIYGNKANAYALEIGVSMQISVTGCAITLRGFQAAMTGATALLNPTGTHDAGDILFQDLLIKGGVGATRAITKDGDATCNIYTCIIFDEWDYGARCNEGTMNIYQTDIETNNHGTGFRDAGGVTTIKNCAIFNNVDDFNGGDTIDYCASDDGDGTNAIAPSGGNWANEFNNFGAGDFTLLAGGNLEQGCNGDVSGGAITTDIIDVPYWGNWDCGAFAIAEGGVIEVYCVDGIELSDTATVQANLQSTATDGVKHNDSSTATMILQAAAADIIKLSDNSPVDAIFQAVSSDSIILSDSSSVMAELLAGCTDGIKLSDVNDVIKILDVVASDIIKYSDSSTVILTIYAEASDGIKLSDLTSGLSELFGVAADSIKFSDIGTESEIILRGNITIQIILYNNIETTLENANSNINTTLENADSNIETTLEVLE